MRGGSAGPTRVAGESPAVSNFTTQKGGVSIHPTSELSIHLTSELSIHPKSELSIHPTSELSIHPTSELSIHPTSSEFTTGGFLHGISAVLADFLSLRIATKHSTRW